MMSLHYPDSCIFLELFSKERGNKSKLARAYVYNINKKYNVIISNLSFGEISRGLLKIEGEMKQVYAFHTVNDILLSKEVDIISPQFEDCELMLRLKKIDYKLEPADALHLAMAMNKKAQVFTTLGERQLANNERIKDFCRKKGLKIEVLGD